MLCKDDVIEAAGQYYEGKWTSFENENILNEVFAIFDIHTQNSGMNFFHNNRNN